MGSNEALVVYTPRLIPALHLKTRSFRLASGHVEVEQGSQGGVGASVWLGSLWLARYVECHVEVRHKRVLELGAGCGGMGSIAALRGGATVLATDGDADVLRLLERNTRRAAPDGDLRGTLAVRWGDSLDRALALLGGSPHVVLAADVVYPGNRDAWPLLVQTLAALSPAMALLAHTHRYPDVDTDFFALARAHFDIERIETTDLRLLEDEDEDDGRPATSIFRLAARPAA